MQSVILKEIKFKFIFFPFWVKTQSEMILFSFKYWAFFFECLQPPSHFKTGHLSLPRTIRISITFTSIANKRVKSEIIMRRLFNAAICGSRRAECPCISWKEQIEEALSSIGVINWRRRARNRGAWKDVLRQAETR